MAQNCVKHEKWDYQCMITNHWWLQTVAASEGRTSNARSKKEVRKSAIYALKKNKSQRWRPQRSRSAKKKRGGKSVGGTGALMRCLSYSRGETAETSCLSVWTQGCLPIAALNYGQVPRIYRKHPPTGGKKKNIIYHVFCFLYSQQNIWVCDGSEERKITLTATLQAENSLLPFSQGCELLTKARVCVPAQGRSTTGLFSVSPTLRWNRTLTCSEQAPSFRPPGEQRAEDWVLQKQTKFQMRHSGRMSARVYRNSIPLLHATLENDSQPFPKTIHFCKSSPDKDQKIGFRNTVLFKGAVSSFFLIL